MLKRNYYFSFLKPIFCLLFFTISGLVFGMTIIQEPDSVTNTAGKDYFVGYDKKRDLYFGMELVTSKNVVWWKKRLAYEAYMHFKSQEKSKLDLWIQKDRKLYKLIEGLFENIYCSFRTEIEQNSDFIDKLQTNSDFIMDWSIYGKANGFLPT